MGARRPCSHTRHLLGVSWSSFACLGPFRCRVARWFGVHDGLHGLQNGLFVFSGSCMSRFCSAYLSRSASSVALQNWCRPRRVTWMSVCSLLVLSGSVWFCLVLSGSCCISASLRRLRSCFVCSPLCLCIAGPYRPSTMIDLVEQKPMEVAAALVLAPTPLFARPLSRALLLALILVLSRSLALCLLLVRSLSLALSRSLALSCSLLSPPSLALLSPALSDLPRPISPSPNNPRCNLNLSSHLGSLSRVSLQVSLRVALAAGRIHLLESAEAGP
eukprot:3757026-Rhodomonas_salina.3